MVATLKTGVIQEPSSGTANLTLDASGGVTVGQNLTVAGTTTFTGGSTFTGNATAAAFIPSGSTVPTNGLYRPAANTVGLATNSTNALYIDASQNVGIGTSSPAYKLDVNSNANINGTAVMSSPYTMRNKIINGAMQFAQRGSGVAVTGTTSYYALDRFFAVVNGGTTGAGSKMYQSTTVPSNFQYSLKFGRESGGTSTNNPTIGQVIESANCYDMQGQTVTFSFYAKAGANYSASGSAFSVNLVTGTGTDQGSANIFGSWTGQVNNVNNFTLTTSWQRFSFTASIGSTVTEIGFLAYYTPVGTAGADDYFYITGVQLERGTVATPFEYRNYQQELAMCRRYYKPKAGNYNTQFLGAGTSGYNQGYTISLNTTMRVAPTVTVYDGVPTAGKIYFNGNGVTGNVDFITTDQFRIYATTPSTGAITFAFDWEASAEL